MTRLFTTLEWLLTQIEIDTSDIDEEKRKGITSASLSIAIPFDLDVIEKTSRNGVLHAFLPTTTIVGLPFLINGDFVLVPSRDNINDGEWNKNLLKTVPRLFCAIMKVVCNYYFTDNEDLDKLASLWTVLDITCEVISRF